MNGRYHELTGGEEGGIVNPLITGLNACSEIDFYLDGGCPSINGFDVLEKTAPAVYLLEYPGYGEQNYYAGIGNGRTNSAGFQTATAWLGFSYMNVRNIPTDVTIPARNNLIPATTISFDLAQKGPVSLRIYNVAGRLVRTLVDGERDAGSYSEIWDGKNETGSSLGSGVYFLRMKTGAFESTRKLVLLR